MKKKTLDDRKEIKKSELEEFFNKGLWYEDIGEVYGISHRAVRDKTKKFNMNIPRKNARKKVDLGNCIFCNKTFKIHCKYC